MVRKPATSSAGHAEGMWLRSLASAVEHIVAVASAPASDARLRISATEIRATLAAVSQSGVSHAGDPAAR